MKRNSGIVLGMLALVLAGAAYAASPASKPLTLLVVPARYNVLQAAFDTASIAPIVLVSYQGEASTENPLLHAWNGSEWVYVSGQDFQEAQFLQVTPGEAILVGDQNLLPPSLVSAVSAWCPKTITVPTTDTTALFNALGNHLSFSGADWKWIASRYNMTLSDLNADRRQESWYDQRGYQDEMTEKIRSLPRPRRGRPARGSVSRDVAPVMPSPADVVTDVAPVPVTMPPPQEEPAAPATAPEAPAVQGAPASEPPPGWQEKAVSAEEPIK